MLEPLTERQQIGTSKVVTTLKDLASELFSVIFVECKHRIRNRHRNGEGRWAG